MLQPFGVQEFLYTGRNKIDSELENGAKFQTFEELLRKSDFVIITCALTPETKDKFNQEAFDLMKPTSVLINTSRGGTYHLVTDWVPEIWVLGIWMCCGEVGLRQAKQRLFFIFC